MAEKLYTLKKDQLSFLIENISNKHLISKLDKVFESGNLIIKGYKTNKHQITFSKGEILILLDALTLIVTSQGLKNNDEPNRFGLFAEELIDIFSK